MTVPRDTLSPERREEMRAYDRARYAEERERRIARAIEWNKANPEKARAGVKKWQQENRERRNEWLREWRKKNPDRVRAKSRAYNARHRPAQQERNRQRKALLLGATIVPFSLDQLDARMDYWGRKCWMCGGPFEQVDHVKPLSKGGAHALCNLRPSCSMCNATKNSTWPYDTARR